MGATPHNGHSNSFSALLELLDPQRFTRGVTVNGDKQLQAVMVRRLKQDLRDAGIDDTFPERHVVQLALRHERGEWWVRERRWERTQGRYVESEAHSLGAAEPFELQLEKQLAHYTDLSMREGSRAADAEHMRKRLKRIDEEGRFEPEQIEALYQVALQRLTPVGLVVLWPSTRS